MQTAEQQSKPTTKEFASVPQKAKRGHSFSRLWLPVGMSLVTLLAGCFDANAPSTDPAQQTAIISPVAADITARATPTARSPQSEAAITRIASTLAEPKPDLPTITPTPVADSALAIGLPTVTPTIVPSPVATRTIELSGDATLRVRLNSSSFESNGQPVTIDIEPRTLVLGEEKLAQSDKWCVQMGATGLVFDLRYTLQPVTENLLVKGELQLHDGFCGEWGKLGNLLATVPLDLTVPVGTAAELSPALQVQGALLGLPNLLDISTGVYLNLTIRNPSPS